MCSCMCCVLRSYTALNARSLLTAHDDHTTLLLMTDKPIFSPGAVWGFLRCTGLHFSLVLIRRWVGWGGLGCNADTAAIWDRKQVFN